MKSLILIFIFFIYTEFSYSFISQNQGKIDSLFIVLKEFKEDSNRVKILNDLSAELRIKGDYENSLKYANEALITCENIGQKNILSLMLQKGIAIANYNIANIYHLKGDYAHALEIYFKGLKIVEELGAKKEMGAFYNNIAILQKEKGDYERALQFYFKALEIFKEIGDKQKMASLYINVGSMHSIKNDYTKALEFYFIALKIFEEIGAKKGMATSYDNIGALYADKSKYDQALEFFFKALRIREESGYKQGMLSSYQNIGELYIKQNKPEEGKKQLLKSLSVSKEIKEKPSLINTYRLLAVADSAIGNFKSAYEHYRLYSQTKDSIFNVESNKQLTEMQTKYESEKKELQIENLNKDNEIKESEIKKQNLQKIVFASGFLLTLVLAFFIFRGYKLKQRANHLLGEKNILIEEQKKHIEEKHKETTDSITYARRLQQAILPPTELIKKYFQNSFVLYKPKDIVAGDFYWMEIIDNIIFIAAADCTGHGVPGAMVSVVCSNALNRTVKEFGLRDTGKILDKVTDLVLETFEKSISEVKDGMDISLLSYNLTNKQIQWSGANNPLWFIQNGQVSEIAADKQPVGKFDKRKPFTQHSIENPDNATFYLFTDGLPDQFGGPKGKKFMYRRFEENLLSFSTLTMQEQEKQIEKAFHDWKGTLEQVDDVTVIGIKI